MDALRALWASIAAQCAAADTTGLLPWLSRDNTARDMDAIRAAIGEPKISFWGNSYGAYLGYRYAMLFPGRPRAAVLDAGVDPALDLAGVDAGQAGSMEAALNHFLDLCAHDSACPFHGGDDPAKAYDALIARLRTTPLPIAGLGSVGFPEALNAVVTSLSGTDWPGLASALSDADHGHGSALQSQASDFGSQFIGSSTAIWCLSLATPRTAAEIEASYAAARRTSPRLGATYALDFTCLDWPDRPTASPAAGPPAGLPPVLVIGSKWDPWSPYSWAAKLAAALGTGVVLTRDGLGHGAWLTMASSECLTFAAQRYMLDLQTPVPGTVCTDPPVSFGT